MLRGWVRGEGLDQDLLYWEVLESDVWVALCKVRMVQRFGTTSVTKDTERDGRNDVILCSVEGLAKQDYEKRCLLT